MSEREYVALLTRADSAMGAQQDHLMRDFHLGRWPRGYRAPSSDSTRYTFMLLRNVRWATAGRLVQSYIVSRQAGGAR
jgi:hypothetical protein